MLKRENNSMLDIIKREKKRVRMKIELTAYKLRLLDLLMESYLFDPYLFLMIIIATTNMHPQISPL